VVGGNSKHEVPLQLQKIGMFEHSVVGVNRGTLRQLRELVQLVAAKKVCYFV